VRYKLREEVLEVKAIQPSNTSMFSELVEEFEVIIGTGGASAHSCKGHHSGRQK